MNRGIPHSVVAAFAVAALLAGCKSGPNDPANLTAIDSMLVQVDSLTGAVNGIDLAVYARMDSVFATQKERIEVRMRDTLDRSTAMTLGNYYRAMNGSLGRVRRDRGALLEELQRSRKQLTDLRHDVSGGLLPPGPERTYVDQERLFLTNAVQRLSVLLNSAGNAQRNWDDHHAAIDSLLYAPPAP